MSVNYQHRMASSYGKQHSPDHPLLVAPSKGAVASAQHPLTSPAEAAG